LSADLKDKLSFLLTMKSPIALFLLLPVLLLAQSNGSRQPAPLVLAHVAVIDLTGGPSDMTVVFREDRISDIGKGLARCLCRLTRPSWTGQASS
jgi:hypothetical protein